MQSISTLRPALTHIGGLFALALSIQASPVQAQGIVATSGLTLIAPPSSTAEGTTESNSTAFAFRERQDLTLVSPLAVDTTTAGSFVTASDLTPGTIAAGTNVNSLFLFSDPVGTPSNNLPFNGSITFDSDILGVMIQPNTITNSDSLLGAPGTTYVGSSNGYDLLNGSDADTADSIVVSPDLHTLTFHALTAANVDSVRIITAATPEPGALALFSGIACTGLVCFRRSRARSKR